MKKISYLDGERLRRALIAGSNFVIDQHGYLDKINVYPVPDGDTGTNLASTMHTIAEALNTNIQNSIAAVSQVAADSGLMGARGNSGAIFAQFFQGLSEGLKGKVRVRTVEFATALENAAKLAVEAIANPIEGTILTVMKDWVQHIKDNANQTHDYVQLMRESVKSANDSLADTPNKLPILKKSGVVDAGAQGFVYMLEGIIHFIEKGKISKDSEDINEIEQIDLGDHSFEFDDDLKFPFCTEAVIIGEEMDRKVLKEKLMTVGDSTVIAGSDTKIRVHTHTDHPKAVFDVMREFGLVQNEKVDDMAQQQRDSQGHNKNKIALITDTACDLPKELIKKYNIHRIPLRLYFGVENYLDQMNISADDFYEKIEQHDDFPKSSQPAASEFNRMYQLVTNYFKSAISIHVPAKYSGTYQAGKLAAGKISDQISVIDTKNLSVGIGLIAIEAAEAINAGKSHEEVTEIIDQSIKDCFLIINFKTMDYAVRGGRISKAKGLLARLLGLKPLIGLDADATLLTLAKAYNQSSAYKKLWEVIQKQAQGKTSFKFAIGHADAPEDAAFFEEKIKSTYNPDLIYTTKISPALGVHCGPGAIAIAMLAK